MKAKIKGKILLLVPVLFLAVFLIWQSQKDIGNVQGNFIITKKVYKIYTEPELEKLIKPKVEQFFKSEQKEYELVGKDEAEVVISKAEQPDRKNLEIGKLYSTEYVSVDYNTWQAKNETIYFSAGKISGAKDRLKEYLQKELQAEEWNLVAVGDIMLARHVGRKMIDAGNWNLPFLKTAELTKSADICFANLESPFAEGEQKIFAGMVFGADPQAVAGLKTAGIDIISLANNHFGNQGRLGMDYTFQLLKQNGIEFVGAGENSTKAHEAKILNVKGLKIAFLAYDGVDSTPQSYTATADSAGLAKWGISQLQKDIKAAETQKPDLIVVSMHAGNEYVYQPRQDKVSFAKAAIDAGADLVIGHHPHSIQSIESYKGKLIFYSLGNFVFDQMWSEKTKEGLVVKISFYGDHIKSFDLIPVYIVDYNQPQLVSQDKAVEILNHILPISNF